MWARRRDPAFNSSNPIVDEVGLLLRYTSWGGWKVDRTSMWEWAAARLRYFIQRVFALSFAIAVIKAVSRSTPSRKLGKL
jgi:hypothetical protein